MSDRRYHIAQINIAHMRAPLEDPQMAGFETRLDEINLLADQSPGFIWRLQTEDGDATSIEVFDDPLILVNLSVWASLEDLHRFVYDTSHLELLRGKKNWFERPDEPHLALWWIAAGEIPDVEEARKRLFLLQEAGPGPEAFSFSTHFPQPGTMPSGQYQEGLDECPWPA